MALRLVSLFLLFPVMLANAKWASGLVDEAHYIARQNGGRCSAVGELAGLGIVLPWLFLALGVAAAAELIFRGRFGLSAALLVLHVVQLSFMIRLLILGSSYCAGASVGFVVRILSGVILLELLFAVLPLPVLLLQIRAIRKQKRQESGAL